MPPPANRLAREKSPYLRQHARNPVDWLPWGSEAFEKARRENKPIFLSIGYSTCHWCHVMARESFESEATAEMLNSLFVPVKVDREERPDVDRVYMTFVQATTGSGGWPLSAWLLPDGRPFLGGTYFPPEDRYGRRGFPAVLRLVADAWRDEPQNVEAQAAGLTDALRKHTQGDERPAATDAARGPQDLEAAVGSLWEHFDRSWGGWGGAPKFPRPAMLRLVARCAAADAGISEPSRRRALEMLGVTLRKMAMGGMHDVLGGGFHRYSVDGAWHVPHFEKMLYDQGQLVDAYLDGFLLTGEQIFADTARDVLAYVRRDLTSPRGGFYSAEDADSSLSHERPEEHAEGAFYVWTTAELAALLTPDELRAWSEHYGVVEAGNAPPGSDPHGEFVGKNIFFAGCPESQTATVMERSVEEVRALLESARAKLFAARGKRPRPHRDEKVLTAWNGLMIGAFARAARFLGDTACAEDARRAAEFLRRELWDEASGQLGRSWLEGNSGIPGFADDYVFLAGGLLDLYEAAFDPAHLAWAIRLMDEVETRFADPARGGLFGSDGRDPSVLLRLKEDHDGAEPAASSAAVLVLQRLAALTDREDFLARARRHAAAFVEPAARQAHAMPLMLAAQAQLARPPAKLVVAGDPAAPDTGALLRAAAEGFRPGLAVARAGADDALRPVEGRAAAYLCRDFACQPPVTDPAELRALLDGVPSPTDSPSAALLAAQTSQ